MKKERNKERNKQTKKERYIDRWTEINKAKKLTSHVFGQITHAAQSLPKLPYGCGPGRSQPRLLYRQTDVSKV